MEWWSKVKKSGCVDYGPVARQVPVARHSATSGNTSNTQQHVATHQIQQRGPQILSSTLNHSANISTGNSSINNTGPVRQVNNISNATLQAALQNTIQSTIQGAGVNQASRVGGTTNQNMNLLNQIAGSTRNINSNSSLVMPTTLVNSQMNTNNYGMLQNGNQSINAFNYAGGGNSNPNLQLRNNLQGQMGASNFQFLQNGHILNLGQGSQMLTSNSLMTLLQQTRTGQSTLAQQIADNNAANNSRNVPQLDGNSDKSKFAKSTLPLIDSDLVMNVQKEKLNCEIVTHDVSNDQLLNNELMSLMIGGKDGVDEKVENCESNVITCASDKASSSNVVKGNCKVKLSKRDEAQIIKQIKKMFVAQVDGNGTNNGHMSDSDSDDEDTDMSRYINQDDQADDGDDNNTEEPLNSDDDQSDDEDIVKLFESDNVVMCQFEKVSRTRTKWKFTLKDGIMHINGKDYCFQRCAGEAEW
uniref:General transcription factor IIA subunit 1 n=1 Tax=Rhabditophanes sp. KR3021 TaxID=114890 RepID=A0AC35TM90_9BILA